MKNIIQKTALSAILSIGTIGLSHAGILGSSVVQPLFNMPEVMTEEVVESRTKKLSRKKISAKKTKK